MAHMDTLETLESFLKKRDGLDKVLKLIRYTSKLTSWYRLRNSEDAWGHKLKSLESNLGISRKAFRLGKFIGNAVSVRKALSSQQELQPLPFLLLFTESAEGSYYFLDQLSFLLKIGVIEKRHGKKLQTILATFELLSYLGSIVQKLIQLQRLYEAERKLVRTAQLRVQSGLQSDKGAEKPTSALTRAFLARNESDSLLEGELGRADSSFSDQSSSVLELTDCQSPQRLMEKLQVLHGGRHVAQQMQSLDLASSMQENILMAAVNGLAEHKQHGSGAAALELLHSASNTPRDTPMSSPYMSSDHLHSLNYFSFSSSLPNNHAYLSRSLDLCNANNQSQDTTGRCRPITERNRAHSVTNFWRERERESKQRRSIQLEQETASSQGMPSSPLHVSFQDASVAMDPHTTCYRDPSSKQDPRRRILTVDVTNPLPVPLGTSGDQKLWARHPTGALASALSRGGGGQKASMTDEEEQCRQQSVAKLAIKCGVQHAEKLAALRAKMAPVRLTLLQDFADALVAIGDLRGEGSSLAHPVFVSLSGILSAAIGVYSKWGS